METSMKKAMAMSTGSDICTRPWSGANTAHAGAISSVQGRTVPVAGDDSGRDLLVADVRTTGVDAIAPFTGVVYPRLEAPPV
ncbi:MAG TPA: hypothetical protein VFU85_02320 [Nocardioides sp.]|nr:hypothetical protein [Nocardioides sp.]